MFSDRFRSAPFNVVTLTKWTNFPSFNSAMLGLLEG